MSSLSRQAPADPMADTRAPALLDPLTRLTLHRERRSILAWVAGQGALALYCVLMLKAAYPTPQERYAAAQAYSTPAASLFTGPGYGLQGPAPTLGALVAAQALGWMALVAALMGVLMVVARTRGDEDGGPAELLRAAPVGRLGSARASLVAVALAATTTAVVCAASALAGGLEAADSLAMGAGLLLVCLAAAGAGLVLAALAPSVRSARGGGLLLVLTWFLLRGLGDASGQGSPGASLSWLSPIGLLQQARLYAGLRWQPLAILAAAALALVLVGLVLHSRRELGEGVVRAGGGGARRRPGPRGAAALARRTSAALRGWWAVAALSFGLVYGVFAPIIEDSFQEMLADNPAMQAFLGEELSVPAYLDMIIDYGGILAAACAVALAVSAVGEEERGLTSTVLAQPVTRRRWLGVGAGVLVRGSVSTLAAMGVGLAGSAIPALMAQGSPAVAEPGVLALAIGAGLIAQLPAVLLAGAWVLALHALVPRTARPLGWGGFVLALSIAVLGPMARAPQWLLNASPFTHGPALPAPGAGAGGSEGAAGAALVWGPAGAWAGPAVCLALALLLVVAALVAVGRRDLRG